MNSPSPKIAKLERELFIEIVRECIEEKGNKRLSSTKMLSSPTTIAEKLHDKYRCAADNFGTCLMAQEGAYGVCNLLEGTYERPYRCAELLAMNDGAFLELVGSAAEESILNAFGIE